MDRAPARSEETDGLELLLAGSSRPIQALRALVRQVARSSVSVLLTGPSGSGKEVVARAIHARSARGNGPFVALNCGAIPRDLLESELFGHERGAFTGAHQLRRGRFEVAHGGSIFLDEIGDMPLDMQVKLLRVLEDRAIERVGGGQRTKIDVRVISATHRDLETAIAEGRFREDLYFRLNILPIRVPSLAERAEDVPVLVEHFARSLGGQFPAVWFSAEALALLQAHTWPGNVRELRNFVERASVLFPGQEVGAAAVATMLGVGRPNGLLRVLGDGPAPADRAAVDRGALPAGLAGARRERAGGALDLPALDPAGFDAKALVAAGIDLRGLLAAMEATLIRAALDNAGDVVAEAARMLSLQRTTLVEKMRRYDIGRAA